MLEEIKNQFAINGYLLVDHTSGTLGAYESRYIVECTKCKTQKTTAWQYRSSQCMTCRFSLLRDNLWAALNNKANSLQMHIISRRDEFTNERGDIEIECEKSHKYTISGVHLKKTKGCKFCLGKNTDKLDLHNLSLTMRDNGWRYISGDYENKESLITAACSAGHKITKKYRAFSAGCVTCQHLNQRSSFKELANIIESEGYKVVGAADEDFTFETKFSVLCPLCSNEFRTSRRAFITDETRCPHCALAKNFSAGELELTEWLRSVGYYPEKVKIAAVGEIDAFIREKSLGVEFNGIYFHSNAHVENSYHYKKYCNALEQGIRLIQIWEDEWYVNKDIIKSILLQVLKHEKNLTKVHARKCDLIQPKKETVEAFLEKNHLMGWAPYSAALALYYENEPVQMLTLAHHHRTGSEITLSRLCTKMNTTVVGGFSKLLSQCPKPLVTWSDNRFSNGDVYAKVGFKQDGIVPPDYQYVKSGMRVSKQSMRKKEDEKLTGKTELELRADQGYYRIYDAGKIKWQYR